MKISCCDMVCPQPVLETKKAIENLEENTILDIELNSFASVENVKRFLTNQGYEFKLDEKEDITVISVAKGFLCEITKEKNTVLNKTVFIKDDKVGDGSLGLKLMQGFLKTILEFDKLPKNIILVNKGVFLTTKKEYQAVIDILSNLEKKGVKIYSCGLCLEHFGIDPQDLKVGEIGNAYDTMDMLLNTDTVSI